LITKIRQQRKLSFGCCHYSSCTTCHIHHTSNIQLTVHHKLSPATYTIPATFNSQCITKYHLPHTPHQQHSTHSASQTITCHIHHTSNIQLTVHHKVSPATYTTPAIFNSQCITKYHDHKRNMRVLQTYLANQDIQA